MDYNSCYGKVLLCHFYNLVFNQEEIIIHSISTKIAEEVY